MADIAELYDTALFDIAKKMQTDSLHFEAVHCQATVELAIALRMQHAIITSRMRATRKLHRAIMRILSFNITPQVILAKINQRRLTQATKFTDAHLKSFTSGGAEAILDGYRAQFVKILTECGVRDQTAWGLASHLLVRRADSISFLNTTDDVGQTLLLNKPDH